MARVLRSHGLGGEMRVVPFSHELRNISVGGTVFIAAEPHQVLSVLEVTGGLIVSTDRVRSREDAAALQGELLEVPHEALAPLDEGSYYVADLIGLTAVNEAGDSLGTVTEVMATGANDVYVVTDAEGGELLLPAIADVVLEIDVPNGRIMVNPMNSATGKALDEST